MKRKCIVSALATAAVSILISGCTTSGPTVSAVDVTWVHLNTGFNHLSPPFDPQIRELGESDPKWIVIEDPVDSTTEPRPATVVTSPGWDPLSQSAWVGPYPTGTMEVIDSPAFGEYVYLYCFCICEEGETGVIAGQLRASGRTTVQVNATDLGVLVGNPGGNSDQDPVQLGPIPDRTLQPGVNCLRVSVFSDLIVGGGGFLPNGFDISGFVAKLKQCQGTSPLPGVPIEAVDFTAVTREEFQQISSGGS